MHVLIMLHYNLIRNLKMQNIQGQIAKLFDLVLLEEPPSKQYFH